MKPGDREEHSVYKTAPEAHAAARELNQATPRFGFSPWHVGGGERGFAVVRVRGVMADDVGVAAREYELALRDEFEEGASAVRKDLIKLESVELADDYPKTRLETVFASLKQPGCRFAKRHSTWPADYRDPGTEASFLEIDFAEFLSSKRARPVFNGPCSKDEVNWL